MAEQWLAPLCDVTKGIHTKVFQYKTFLSEKNNNFVNLRDIHT